MGVAAADCGGHRSGSSWVPRGPHVSTKGGFRTGQYGRSLAQRFAGLGATIDDQPIGSTRSCRTGCGGPTRR
jgi:hypothetical protein